MDNLSFWKLPKYSGKIKPKNNSATKRTERFLIFLIRLVTERNKTRF